MELEQEMKSEMMNELLVESNENYLLELELRPMEIQFGQKTKLRNQSQHSTHFLLLIFTNINNLVDFNFQY